MSIFSWAVSIIFTIIVVVRHSRKRRRSIGDVRGPPTPSPFRWTGHEMQLRHQLEVGDLEFPWVHQYGPTYRTKGCFNEDILWTSDPKALQYILQASGYRYPKPKWVVQITRNHLGTGILSAHGEAHQRQRKLMAPAFSAGQLRTFLPLFRRAAGRLSQKWKDEIESDANANVINVHRLLTRSTLDIIGEAGFDYQFGAVDGKKNELAQEFEGLFLNTVLHPPAWDLLFKATWRYIPDIFLQYVKYMPTKEYRRFRHFLNTTFRVGREILQQNASTEKGSKDIMSILVQSNNSEDKKRRLSDVEVLSQISTFVLAGHDTIATSLDWILYELSQNVEDQRKLREEIRRTRNQVEARGDEDFVPSDFDGMHFMNAVIKESLRLHPIVPTLSREAGHDDIIPLSEPMTTVSGEVITEIPVNKDQAIMISIASYNRLPTVWGNDADLWNPDRFLDEKEKRASSVGVYANLLTFSAGVRACIGWRFAMLEMQAIITELIETFEFKLPKDANVARLNSGLMVPLVKDKLEMGIQMPLHVSLAQY